MPLHEGITTFTADVALTQGARVKIKTGTTTTPPEVDLAGINDRSIGTVEAGAAADALVDVRLNTQSGTRMCIAAGAFAVGATIYGAANGKVDDVATAAAIYGQAKEAATADGDLVEIVTFGTEIPT